jgi:hypothetical protein
MVLTDKTIDKVALAFGLPHQLGGRPLERRRTAGVVALLRRECSIYPQRREMSRSIAACRRLILWKGGHSRNWRDGRIDGSELCQRRTRTPIVRVRCAGVRM